MIFCGIILLHLTNDYFTAFSHTEHPTKQPSTPPSQTPTVIPTQHPTGTLVFVYASEFKI